MSSPLTSELPQITAYSDGGCDPNPGPGGWGVVLRYKSKVTELSGAAPETTNNRMELQAAIEALKALKRPCLVHLHTDSQYVQKGITSWISGWKRNGWITAKKEPVLNADLWKVLDELSQKHKVTWQWVKGHSGVPDNERCDQLASEAWSRLTGKPPKPPREQISRPYAAKRFRR
jgi:ribonuclease HI